MSGSCKEPEKKVCDTQGLKQTGGRGRALGKDEVCLSEDGISNEYKAGGV